MSFSARPDQATKFDRRQRQRAIALAFITGVLHFGCGAELGLPATPGTTAPKCARGTSFSNAVAVSFEDIKFAARAQAYEGRRVRIRGYLTIDFEDTSLYDIAGTCEELKGTHAERSIVLEMSPDVPYRKLCGQRVAVVEGIYSTQGHSSFLSGLIRDVNFIESAGPVCENRLVGAQ